MNTLHIQHEKELHQRTVFGFWIYLMTDCVLFSILFATYAVLHKQLNGGPAGHEIFSLPFVLAETLLLLTSSLTCGMALLATNTRSRHQAAAWLAVTFILGIGFLAMELTEFSELISAGHGWQRSAFLSSFFVLVSTHGLHITFGLLWIAVMVYQILNRGITATTFRRLTCLSLFWHFLDIIWIFIFTFVYLMEL